MRSSQPRCERYDVRTAIRLRITFQPETACSIAISLSGARKRPLCKPGGARFAKASSFSVGSARRYISVLCMLACPNQSETLRTSPVACKVCIAQVWRSTWGDTRFPCSVGWLAAALITCLARMYSNPDRVMARPLAFRNNSESPVWQRTFIQSLRTATVSFHSGRTRSRRPLPTT